MRETSHDVGGSASSAISRLTGQARGAGQAAGGPIVLGAAAALVGMIAGALVPVSQQEERALGSLAGQLRGKGRDLAQEVVNRGAQVVGDTIGAAKETAQAHGLTADRPVGELIGDLKSGDLIGHVKQAGHDVADAGKNSLRSQFDDRGGRQG